jgi:hypothetical protein
MLYNPTVGANLMSKSFTLMCLGEEPRALIVKSFRIAPQSSLKGLGILHNITLHHGNVEMALDFHVFDIADFDILIGNPLEKLFLDPPKIEDLDIKLGRDTFTIPITRAKNSMAESLPYPNLSKEVMSVLPFDSPKSSLEKDAKLFIEEEGYFGETIDLPQEEAPTRPTVELKPLPAGLRYAFLNGDKETPIIISVKLSNEETSKLIVILEKHRSVFGYSLQDLKGISPTLCTHRILIDPSSTPSQEPQCRLNNAMWEVMKREVLKLFHAKIIYPIPHSDWVSPVQVVPKKEGMMVVKNNKNEVIPQ